MPIYKKSVKKSYENECVEDALELIRSVNSIKQEKDDDNRAIIDLFNEGFDISIANGPRKLESQMLQQVFWRLMSKIKPLDFQVHGANATQELEDAVNAGVETVLRKGCFDSCLSDKGGAFMNAVMYGDGFFFVGTNPEDNNEIPIIFNPIPNTNIYVDNYATSMRAGGIGRSATECCVIFSTSEDQAGKLFPKIKRKKICGKIPREIVNLEETGRNYDQTEDLDDIVEIGYYYNISEDEYLVFAGSECEVILELKGDKYPFKKDGQSYIPIVQIKCMPSLEGFYNYGVGALLNKLAQTTRQLRNMAIAHAEDSVYPMTLLNTPQGQAATLFERLAMADQLRAQGKKAFVVMEQSAGGGEQASASSLVTPAIFQEYQAINEDLTREIRRLGINLDDIGGANKTATQVIQETKSSDAWIEQMMSYNHKEFEFCLEVVLDLMKKTISKKNKTIVDSPVRLKIGDQKLSAKGITLGQVADELNKFKYYVIVDPRSGAVKTDYLKLLQLQNILPLLQPGTPEFQKVAYSIAKLNNIEFDEVPSQPQMPQPGQPQGQQQGGGMPMPMQGGPLPQIAGGLPPEAMATL